QALLSLSLNLTVALLVAEAVCAGNDEILKTKILSTTLFISGICTILMTSNISRTWDVTNTTAVSTNETSETQTDMDAILYRIQMMQGSLIAAGLIQTLLGLTGVVGKLLRYIGPITVVPVVTLIGFSIYRTAIKFCETQWGVSFLFLTIHCTMMSISRTLICGLVLSLYLGNNKTPLPFLSKKKGFHILRYPLHQVFSLLFATIIGWIVSFILTEVGVLSDDPKSKEFLARTDSKTWVLKESPWFYFPYPGNVSRFRSQLSQFGAPHFSIDVFVTFIIATLVSVIDSIGDYYACARICKVPPPPSHAVNRGILVEGCMSVVAGSLGIAHATNSYGPNLGALGITKVASIRVFITVGILYIAFGVFGKFGAFFITIPYSVLGGITIISFGIFIGVNLSNMIYIDLHSTRNLSIIGIAMLLGLMVPYWTQENPDGIKTGKV
ncbi:hypothetical protein KUTeg_002630, partial [Tegillarca granosa]